MLNQIELRAQAERAIGRKLQLRFYDQVQKVRVEPDEVTILVHTFKVKEMAHETRYTARGKLLLSYKRFEMDGHTYWRHDKRNDMLVWDEDFSETYATNRKVKTASEWHEQRNFEAMCYRPGAADFPMDNYDRVMLEPMGESDKSTAKMTRHWEKLGEVSA